MRPLSSIPSHPIGWMFTWMPVQIQKLCTCVPTYGPDWDGVRDDCAAHINSQPVLSARTQARKSRKATNVHWRFGQPVRCSEIHSRRAGRYERRLNFFAGPGLPAGPGRLPVHRLPISPSLAYPLHRTSQQPISRLRILGAMQVALQLSAALCLPFGPTLGHHTQPATIAQAARAG